MVPPAVRTLPTACARRLVVGLGLVLGPVAVVLPAAATSPIAATASAGGQDDRAGLPAPPCEPAGDGATVPAAAPLGPDPNVALWHLGDMPGGWRPPACTGFEPAQRGRLVGLAGRLAADSETAILERIGAVSAHRSIRYWSAGRQEWRTLLDDAFALSAPSAKARRPDFAVDEFETGRSLYIAYDDSLPVGPVVEEMTVRERSPGRLVIGIRNITAARMLGMPVARAGDLEIAIFFDEESKGVWRYYALSRSSLQLPEAMELSDKDYINRAVAMFRFAAGEPTDGTPPTLR